MGSKATKRPWNVQDVTNNSEARTTCYSVSSEFVSSKIDIEVVDVAVNDKDMEVTNRNLKKENKKFGKELVARISPEWVFEDLF